MQVKITGAVAELSNGRYTLSALSKGQRRILQAIHPNIVLPMVWESRDVPEGVEPQFTLWVYRGDFIDDPKTE